MFFLWNNARLIINLDNIFTIKVRAGESENIYADITYLGGYTETISREVFRKLVTAIQTYNSRT